MPAANGVAPTLRVNVLGPVKETTKAALLRAMAPVHPAGATVHVVIVVPAATGAVRPEEIAVHVIAVEGGVVMVMGGKVGASIETEISAGALFGEDQARYIVTVPEAQAGLVLAKRRGCEVPCVRIGTTGGDAISIVGEAPVAIDTLRTAFERWLPEYMGGKAA